MKNTRRYTKVGYTVILAMVISHGPLALAGWTGAMNGTGFGVAQVNVVSFKSGEQSTASTARQDPSAAVTVTPGYFAGAPLPEDASPATVARVKGSAGYIWQAETVGSNGDGTDEPELESRVTIIAADCASLAMNTSAVIDETNKTGTIIVNILGTAGTAAWERGFELPDPQFQNPPPDDTNTLANEFIEYLKAHGSLKFDVLTVGPQNLNTTNCNAIQIPFAYVTHITNVYLVSQGVAKSLPLVIECPNDIVVNCGQTVPYPATLQVGGCGNIAISFNPPPTNAPAGSTNSPFVVGTNLVTVTATDINTNTASCTFNVIVRDTTPPVIVATGNPLNGVLGDNPTAAQIEAALGTATATDPCGPVGTLTPTAVDSSVTANSCSTSQTRTWNVSDAAGNAATPVSRTVTWGGVLSFTGFYPPIGTVSNSCTPPSVVVVNRGSVAPLKWDFFCGTNRITTGTPPTVDIQPVSSNCSLTGTNTTVNAVYQNDWHYNWDTTGWLKGTYKVTANLPDGITKPYVFIKIK